MILKTVFNSFIKVMAKRIRTFLMRMSIGVFFLLFGTYYIIDSIINLVAENFGINLEHLRLIAGIAMVLGSYIILNNWKK